MYSRVRMCLLRVITFRAVWAMLWVVDVSSHNGLLCEVVWRGGELRERRERMKWTWKVQTIQNAVGLGGGGEVELLFTLSVYIMCSEWVFPEIDSLSTHDMFLRKWRAKRPSTKNWGATFNYSTAHVAKLSQLHPKNSTQILAARWKLLGLCPNHKLFCCLKPLKQIWTPTWANYELKQRDETRRSREGSCFDHECHLPASENVPLPTLCQPTTTWKTNWVGFPYEEEMGVLGMCVR